MIFLIDDNQNNQRLNNYNITFVEDGVFDGYLTSIEKIEKKENAADISHLEFLKEADCILLHSTTEDYDSEKGFLEGVRNNSIKIKELISKEGDIVPLVLFSNSMNEPKFNFDTNPNYIYEIKKNLFYERLYDFLNYYKFSGIVELRILAFGKNFKAKEASKYANIILNAILMKKGEDMLHITDVSSVLKELKSFIELAFSESDYSAIINDLEDNPIKISEFRKKINQTIDNFNKYGKNFNSWE